MLNRQILPWVAGAFCWLVLGLAVADETRAQQSLSIDAFVGQWQGMGVASGESGYFLDETVRDLDVTIRGDNSGFTVDWTTVVRKGPVGDRKVERKETSVTFQPSPQPNVFQSTDSGDLFAGESLTWARLDRQTLVVYHLVLNEEGAMELSRYSRTLLGGGMELEFTRLRDGEPVRSVEGQLIKVAQ